MEAIKSLYLKAYFIIMALYVYLNKGIAYSFLVEALWLGGIILLILNRHKYIFIWEKRVKILLFFMLITLGYILWGAKNYSLIDSIRDSFVFEYGWFVFIIFLYQDKLDLIWDNLFHIYKWFPLVALFNFILQYYVPFFETVAPFGNIPILLFKNGDMGVHLMICTILVILNIKKLTTKWLISLAILILFNFLVVAAYSRSGMLAYIVGVFSFIYFSKDNYIKEAIKGFTKYIPWALVIVIPIYLSIQVRENFQGRAAGFTQIKENITSLTTNTDNKISEDNILWRFAWWTKIIDYSFSKEYFLHGKGLGMSLAQSDDIIMTEDDVRSPHSFHLTIMARYGIPLFLLWLYWIFLLIKPLFKRKLSLKEHAITCILISFIVNASFDVFLEGPMGAFPFWTWVGLLFMSVGVANTKAADSISLDTGSDTNNITDTDQADSITQPNS